MNTHDGPSDVPLTASRKYVHLYMPIITTTLIMTNTPTIKHYLEANEDHPMAIFLLLVVSTTFTYYVASKIYPANRPDPTPEEAIRFTRKHDAYRALVLATYGRLYGTPFNLQFLIIDFIYSYAVGAVIGERPVGARQRRSEFFIALLWVAGSNVIQTLVPPTMPTLASWTLTFDRAVWRAAYVALVDDVVGVLAYPNVRTLRGKLTLVLVQAFTRIFLTWFAVSWIQRFKAGHMSAEAF
jgi:hypothetical protein